MQLTRYSYISKATGPLSAAELLQLRLSAEKWNDRNNVTGLLLFDGSRFVQLIEGWNEQMVMVVDRIVADRRHHAIQVIQHGPAPDRQFDGWALKTCWRLAGANDLFLTEVKRAVRHCPEPAVQALFIGFGCLPC